MPHPHDPHPLWVPLLAAGGPWVAAGDPRTSAPREMGDTPRRRCSHGGTGAPGGHVRVSPPLLSPLPRGCHPLVIVFACRGWHRLSHPGSACLLPAAGPRGELLGPSSRRVTRQGGPKGPQPVGPDRSSPKRTVKGGRAARRGGRPPRRGMSLVIRVGQPGVSVGTWICSCGASGCGEGLGGAVVAGTAPKGGQALWIWGRAPPQQHLSLVLIPSAALTPQWWAPAQLRR